MIKDLILKNRTYRRFVESQRVGMNDLLAMVDNARIGGSGRNSQPLKYILSCDTATNHAIFETLTFARNLGPSGAPGEGERPAAYIVILYDKAVSDQYYCDHGIAATNILLTAVEMGYGGAIIASIDRDKLSGALEIPSGMEILLALAIGKPKETIVLEPLPDSASTVYWRTEDRVHHVPKRGLDEIIVRRFE